jgi:hypothetical protein
MTGNTALIVKMIILGRSDLQKERKKEEKRDRKSSWCEGPGGFFTPN